MLLPFISSLFQSVINNNKTSEKKRYRIKNENKNYEMLYIENVQGIFHFTSRDSKKDAFTKLNIAFSFN